MKQSLIPFLLFAITTHAADCSLPQREASTKNRIDVTISTEHWTRVVFPEASLKGIEPVDASGLVIDQRVTLGEFKNHIQIKSESNDYSTKLFVYGESGKHYQVNLSTNICGDSKVQVLGLKHKKSTKRISSQSSNADEREYRYLSTHMAFIGSPPPGYKVYTLNEPEKERLVLEQGSVKFYISKQYIGPKYIGTVFEVVNKGRTAFKLEPALIDFNDPDIINAFGNIHHIGMLPISRELQAKPKSQDINHRNANLNRGLLFVTSRRK